MSEEQKNINLLKEKAPIAVTDLFQRKGVLIVKRELILESNEQVLKEIFSNFFPIDADRHHRIQYWDSIKYYGVSPHFEKTEETCVPPKYDIILDIEEDGHATFNRFVKIDVSKLW